MFRFSPTITLPLSSCTRKRNAFVKNGASGKASLKGLKVSMF